MIPTRRLALGPALSFDPMTLTLDDTIAAIATAAGPAGLAVVRASGRDAVAVADAVFRGAGRLAEAPSHTLHHGWAVWPAAPDRRLDEIVAAVFRAPRSYTREDVVELSCHGGEQSSRRVLEALLAAGARHARAGEFTLRAFLNGRMDLSQAEAVADLIHASTERAHAVALSQLAGMLSNQLRALTERLADATAEVEARVDFAEDVGGIEVPDHVITAIAETDAGLAALLASAAYGRAVREGAHVPIVGRPNVGKSSLFNALVGEDRAIVTSIPGTTRDRVSEAIEIEGIRVRLSDTAGLREAGDAVEAIGVMLAEAAIDAGAVVVWVLDGSASLVAEDHVLAERLRNRRVLVALNKSDRGTRVDPTELATLLGHGAAPVAVSALEGRGLEELRRALGQLLGAGSREASLDAPLSNQRHVEALNRARDALTRATAMARGGAPGEIVALELRECMAAIGEVSGASVDEDLLDRIFGRFCIGK